jgi:hypothetical protein
MNKIELCVFKALDLFDLRLPGCPIIYGERRTLELYWEGVFNTQDRNSL